MKYLWLGLLLLAIILVRIDYFLKLFDRMADRINRPGTVIVSGQVRKTELTAIKDDKAIQYSPRAKFLSLLDNFYTTTAAGERQQALQELTTHPQIFTKQLDPVLEGRIYQWRDRLFQKNLETIIFLAELQKVLEGENQIMVRKFSSLLLDIDLKLFFLHYPRLVDPRCLVAGMTADSLPTEEVINELTLRRLELISFISQGNLDADVLSYANSCLEVIKLNITRLEADRPPAPQNDNEDGEAGL